MKQHEQTRLRRKVLIPLAVMFTVMLIVWTFKNEWYYALLTVIGGLISIAFFYVYMGRIQQSLMDTYRNQQIEIVHRRFAEAQITETAERAEAANRAKSEFLSNMSHELRTPMNAIIGFSGLLKEEDLAAEQRDYVETIITSSEHLLSLINDVLDLSKIEAGKVEMVSERCNLAELFSRVESMMRTLVESKGLSLEIETDPSLPEDILTDTRHLYQCIINLVANAVKFTEKGSVRLSAVRVRDCEQQYIRIDVADTGIGIPSDKQDLIFETFRQADSSTSRKYGGTGLGLSITHKLIGMMGGTLRVQSQKDRGSVFSIHLPLVDSPVFAESA